MLDELRHDHGVVASGAFCGDRKQDAPLVQVTKPPRSVGHGDLGNVDAAHVVAAAADRIGQITESAADFDDLAGDAMLVTEKFGDRPVAVFLVREIAERILFVYDCARVAGVARVAAHMFDIAINEIVDAIVDSERLRKLRIAARASPDVIPRRQLIPRMSRICA